MRKYWYISCSASSLQAVYPLPSTIVGARTAQPLAALPPYGCGVPLAGAAHPPSRPKVISRGCGPGPRGMFVLFLLLQEKYPKEGEKRGTPPFPTPGSVEGLCPSSPAPETCILRHPSTHCRSPAGCCGLARSTKYAWPGSVWEASHRGQSLRSERRPAGRLSERNRRAAAALSAEIDPYGCAAESAACLPRVPGALTPPASAPAGAP